MNRPTNTALKLLLDEQIWFGLASKLRSDGFDAVHVNEVGLSGSSDETVLNFATKEGRAILTFNIRDFVLLYSDWLDKKAHFGIIVSDQVPRGELYRRIKNLLNLRSTNELNNNLIYLQDYK